MKLEYFEGAWGRAYPIVLLLKYQKVRFEYVELSKETWAKRKAEGQTGGLPILHKRGQVLQESIEILKKLARDYDMFVDEEDQELEAKMDSILTTYGKVFEACA